MLRNSFLPLSKNTERKRFLRTDGGIVVFEDSGYNSLFRVLSGSIPDIYTEWVHFARVQGGIVVIASAGLHLLCLLTAASDFRRDGTRPRLPKPGKRKIHGRSV